MPVIPTFENTTPWPAPQAPTMDIAAAGEAAGAVARGAAQIEDTTASWAERYAQSQRAVAASDAMVSSQQTLAQLAQQQTRRAGTRDANGNIIGTDQVVNGFVDQAQGLRQQTIDGIADPLTKAMVAQHFDEAMIGHADSVRNQGFALERDARIGKLDLDLNALAQQAATAPTPEQRAQVQVTATTAINTLRDAGFLPGDQAAVRGITFTSNVAKVQALQYIRAAGEAAAQGRLSPLAISDAIEDPKNFPGLLATERESLADQAIQRGRMIVGIQTGAQAHADAVAERNSKATQLSTVGALLERIDDPTKGNMPDVQEIDHLLRTQQLSLPGRDAAVAALQRNDNRNDTPTLAHLYQLQGAGHDITDDVLAANAAHKINAGTAGELLKGQQSLLRGDDSAIDKANFATLKTAAGGQAAEAGGLLPGEKQEAQQNRVALWTAAQGEWNKRVRINREDSNAVVADMLQRYGKPPAGPEGLPQPRLGAIAATPDVAAVWAKTKAAHDAGQMDDATFSNEGQLLQRYLHFYQDQDKRAAAAAQARGGKPGATPAGVTPAGDQ